MYVRACVCMHMPVCNLWTLWFCLGQLLSLSVSPSPLCLGESGVILYSVCIRSDILRDHILGTVVDCLLCLQTLMCLGLLVKVRCIEIVTVIIIYLHQCTRADVTCSSIAARHQMFEGTVSKLHMHGRPHLKYTSYCKNIVVLKTKFCN